MILVWSSCGKPKAIRRAVDRSTGPAAAAWTARTSHN